MSPVQLDKQVMALPARRRASLASRLLASLDAPLSQPHEKKWAEELEARITAYNQGLIKSVPAAQVLAYSGKSKR